VDRSPLAREPKAPGPPGPEGTSRGWDLVVCWLSGPKVGSGIWDPGASWSLGPDGAYGSWDLIWGSGLRWAPVAGTQMPPDHVTLLQGLGPGTQIRLQRLTSVLEVALVPAALSPAPCLRLQLEP
jgi:hypothetical protein